MQKDQLEVTYAVCPYDSNHKIDKLRMARHVLKCAKNFPIKYREECPFNAAHLLPPSEFHQHVADCPDARRASSHPSFQIKKHGSLRICPPSEYEEYEELYKEKWESDDSNDETDSTNLISFPQSTSTAIKNSTRFPREYPVQVLLELDDTDDRSDVGSTTAGCAHKDNETEYAESIVSGNCMGRGKIALPPTRKVGLPVGEKPIGRGKPHLNTLNERFGQLRVGREVLSDVDDDDDDIESISSASAFGRKLNLRNNDAVSVTSSMGIGRGQIKY